MAFKLSELNNCPFYDNKWTQNRRSILDLKESINGTGTSA